MDRLRALAAREPVRVYVYGTVVALLTVAVAEGWLDRSSADAWAALAAVVLIPAVEAARARVTPYPPRRSAGPTIRAGG